jgi:hypothetical protein
MLQNGTQRGTGGAAEQLARGRMGLGTTCKRVTSRMKNISIETSGSKKKINK